MPMGPLLHAGLPIAGRPSRGDEAIPTRETLPNAAGEQGGSNAVKKSKADIR